jgi:hypothetical protein
MPSVTVAKLDPGLRLVWYIHIATSGNLRAVIRTGEAAFKPEITLNSTMAPMVALCQRPTLAVLKMLPPVRLAGDIIRRADHIARSARQNIDKSIAADHQAAVAQRGMFSKRFVPNAPPLRTPSFCPDRSCGRKKFHTTIHAINAGNDGGSLMASKILDPGAMGWNIRVSIGTKSPS